MQNKIEAFGKLFEENLYEYFKDWDASTGAFLPITLPGVVDLARKLCPGGSNKVVVPISKSKSPKVITKRKLF